MINKDSFATQNKVKCLTIGSVTIRLEGEYYQVISNGQIYMDYIEKIFQLNDRQFFVMDTNTQKWSSFRLVGNSFENLYISDYMILLYPNLMIEYSGKMLHIYDGGFDCNNEIQKKSLLFVADNFKIDKGKLIATNMKHLRLFRFDLKKLTYESEIIKTDKNFYQTPKCDVYFDGLGGLEIYDRSKKTQRVWLTSNRFYRLHGDLWAIKQGAEYTVVDVGSRRIIFKGSVLSYIETQTTISNPGTNEVFILDRKKETIRIYSWDKYQRGETKEWLKHFEWKVMKDSKK